MADNEAGGDGSDAVEAETEAVEVEDIEPDAGDERVALIEKRLDVLEAWAVDRDDEREAQRAAEAERAEEAERIVEAERADDVHADRLDADAERDRAEAAGDRAAVHLPRTARAHAAFRSLRDWRREE